MDIQEINKLSQSKRILLAQEIWDSIDGDSIELTDAIKKELDCRLERHKKGETKYYTLAEVKSMLAKKSK
jgi:putative addiction module component (TIGR02574 family)